MKKTNLTLGLTISTLDCGSLEEAEANCTGNFARAKEIVEERTTAASMEEFLEVEAQLDAGTIDEDGEPVEDKDQSEAQQAREEHNTYAAVGQPEKTKGENTMSDFSSKLGSIKEAPILENLGVGASLIGSHNIIDDVFVAWQLTEDFAAIKIPAYMAEAEQETTKTLTQALGKLEAEQLLLRVEEPAVHQGFALGVQFALAAMRNDGAIWKLISHDR